jgi:hypothetical protein
MGKLATKFHLPLSAKQWIKLQTLAKQIATECPRKQFSVELAKRDIELWADESFHIAVSTVYSGIEAGTKPSDEYIERGYEVVKRQLALGGYRLADLLHMVM